MEEPKEEQKQTVEEKLKEYELLVDNLRFLSDQIKFNSTMYQGFRIIIDKLNKIEELLNGNKG